MSVLYSICSDLWGVSDDEESKNQIQNPPSSMEQYPIDPASVYRNDEQFLHALRKADLTMYSFGAPRTGSPAFSKVLSMAYYIILAFIGVWRGVVHYIVLY